MSAAIIELLGNSFTNKAKENLTGAALAGKTIGVYFSAHWCGPCRGFTPKLAESYNIIKGAGKPFEIVFVSSDRDQASFDEYLGEMPWIALPFAARDLKQKLSKKFKVQGIPTLIILDENGAVINPNGREVLAADPLGDSFPWTPKTFAQAIGTNFVGKNNTTVTLDTIKANADVLFIYFSAHWCPPCRGFTPKLAETYNKLKADGKKVECVFVSADNSKESFEEYYAEMPWLAIPFEDTGRKDDLNTLFEVNGIPQLTIYDLKANKLITNGGRGEVASDPTGQEFPWHPKPLKKFNGSATSYFNDTACFLFFADGTTSDDTVAQLQQVAKNTADHFVAEFAKAGTEDKVVFIYGSKNDQQSADLFAQVREFLGVPKNKYPALVLMDIPNGSKYYCEDLTEAGVRSFVEDYVADKLVAIGLQD